jgi:hypothetical protein
MSLNFFMLCHYSDTIVHDTNNNITCIKGNTVFLNGTRGILFEDTKKIICGRLELNYNDVKIDITWRCLVREHQYFFIPIVCDVFHGSHLDTCVLVQPTIARRFPVHSTM